MSAPDDAPIVTPRAIQDAIAEGQCAYFEQISGIDRHQQVADLLSEAKAHQHAAILQRYAQLKGARILEVGSGLSMILIVWSKRYGADVTGVEPDAEGFHASYKLGRSLAAANGLDPERILNAVGERLPFADDSFDIIYSSNVLEHTDEPAQVLAESMRVLAPGGVMQFVFPNYRSYYDGHYGVFHPPLYWKGFFPWYVRWVWRRDPAFAHTLRTELNVGWVKATLRELARTQRFEVLGLGDDVFRERMESLDFGGWATLGRLKRVLMLLRNRHVRRGIANLIVGLRGWTPIVLTLRKSAS